MQYPDSERLRMELDRASVKGGMVGLGFFEKVRQRVYRLTPAGLLAARDVTGDDDAIKGKVDRAFADAVAGIISHPVFIDWLRDPAQPKYFRNAGHFWGVAPGTPPAVIRRRIDHVDQTLSSAQALLNEKNVQAVAVRHGTPLFDRKDITRAREFHEVLKARFAKDLRTLGVPSS